jgi:phosphopantothenate synthetase
MSQTFADVVEDVRQLSPAEREELQEIIKRSLIEERRREILQNCEAGLQELREGKLTFTSDLEELQKQLADD